MIIDGISFHDSKILEVKETSEQTIEFLLEFPIDWDNNLFEKRILRFKNVISYHIDEIPFAGKPTILEILDLGQIVKTFGTGRNKIEVLITKIDIETNAGKRLIEFSECELIKLK